MHPERRFTIHTPKSPPYVVLNALGAAAVLGFVFYLTLGNTAAPEGRASEITAQPSGPKSLTAPLIREDIAVILEAEGLRTGAELGVQVGNFAGAMLSAWTSCTRYYLVDLWSHQENYDDLANVDNNTQERFFQEAQRNLKPWEGKTVFIRNYTVNAAPLIPDDSLDFIYVDARHDYCGVSEDLVAYWPKLKRGGIIAGHDYLSADDPIVKASGQDWSLCHNGTVNRGAVKGAVDEFAKAHGLTVLPTRGGDNINMWPSWLARKP